MNANLAIDFMNKQLLMGFQVNTIDSIDSEEFILQCIDDIRTSEKFDLGTGLERLFGSESFSVEDLEIWNLPYDKVYFEMQETELGTPLAAVLHKIEDQIEGTFFTPVEDKNERIIGMIPNGILMHQKNGKVVFNSIRKRVEIDELIIKNSYSLMFYIKKALEVINCSNVVIVENEPSRFVNQRKKQKGLCPLFTYKTLHITNEEKKIYRKNGNGTHESPRLHLRRGHIRKLPTGKRIWVQSCLVGDPAKGFSDKDYLVKVS